MAPRSRQSDDGGQRSYGGEQLSSTDVRTALIDGVGFANRAVQYADVGGWAMVEGDICLGRTEDVEQRTAAKRSAPGDVAAGVIISGDRFRWPGGRVPFTIADGTPDQQRIADAIAHWHANTAIRFVPRTTETDFVEFFAGDGCWSHVGRQGGKQQISLSGGCSTGNAIHEIGHTVGLWHEQSREDRDTFVRIVFANIDPSTVHNFDQHITDGDDVGGYDYGSVMHYPRTAFSINGQDTMVPLQPVSVGVTSGQRSGLSEGDKAAVAAMYGNAAPITPVKKVLDDNPVVVTQPPRFNKVLDAGVVVTQPPPFKKIVDDAVVVPPVGPRIPTGGVSPFLLATGHHAAVGSAAPVSTSTAGWAGPTHIDGLGAALQAAQAQLDGYVAAVCAAADRVAALRSALADATDELVAAQQARQAAVEQLAALARAAGSGSWT